MNPATFVLRVAVALWLLGVGATTWATQFSGLVNSADANFGGSPYCSYNVALKNISQQINLSSDGLQVMGSSIDGVHEETGINGCRLANATPTKFQYLMTAQSVVGNTVSIQYANVFNPNFPNGIATFTGTLSNSSITGTLVFRRTDQASILNWSVTTTNTLGISATQVIPPVRFIYVVPSGLAVQQSYIDGIQRAALELQRWYWRQTAGSTFSIASPAVTVCRTNHTEDYYFLRPWDTVSADLSQCVPWQYNDPTTRWVVYADILPTCNSPNRIGAGTLGITIMDRNDLQGLSGALTTVDTCGTRWNFPVGRWIGGLGHEFGHTLGLPHPPGCDSNATTCDRAALMWAGYASFPNTYLRADEKAALRYNPFITTDGLKAADRLFDWAEIRFPNLFGGKKRVLQELEGYYYREYMDTGNFLAVKNRRVYFLQGTSANLLDVGSVDDLLPFAVAESF